VAGTPFADGSLALLARAAEETAAGLDALARGDGDAWLELCRGWDAIGDQVLGALLSPFPPVRNGLGAPAKVRAAGGSFLKLALCRPGASRTGTSPAPPMLLAGNAAHADISMDAGSGMMGWILIMMGQQAGFPPPAAPAC
jgi:phytoene dehydrogenase-like protein